MAKNNNTNAGTENTGAIENTENIGISIDAFIAAQPTRGARETDFVTFTSKEKLFAEGNLPEDIKAAVEKITKTYSFALSKSGKHLILTLFFAKEKAYKYYILTFETKMLAEFASIKDAKDAVRKALIVPETPADTADAPAEDQK